MTMSDDQLYVLLRQADPLTDATHRSPAETEAALRRLTALGPDNGRSPRRRRRPRQRLALRLAPVGLAGAAAVAAVALLTGNGAVPLSSASAKVVLRRAAAEIAGSEGTILHAITTATQTWQGGKPGHFTVNEWDQVSRPYNARTITTGVWSAPVEMSFVNGNQWLYDPGTNTIYTSMPTPAFTLRPGPRSGTRELVVGTQTMTITDAEAAALRSGADIWAATSAASSSSPLEVIPRPTSGPDNLASFRAHALELLRAPGTRVMTGATADGQPATKITSADGATTYYVTPTSDTPIELDQSGSPLPAGSTETLVFSDWQRLTGAAANPRLLDLRAQHPLATVDTSPTDYQAAQNRLLK
jgi:hypothetical protein